MGGVGIVGNSGLHRNSHPLFNHTVYLHAVRARLLGGDEDGHQVSFFSSTIGRPAGSDEQRKARMHDILEIWRWSNLSTNYDEDTMFRCPQVLRLCGFPFCSVQTTKGGSISIFLLLEHSSLFFQLGYNGFGSFQQCFVVFDHIDKCSKSQCRIQDIGTTFPMSPI